MTLVCGDRHTLARLEVQAFDLSEKGDGLPYFRRMMSILHKVLPKPGIEADKIIYEFTTEERDNIYPSLGQNMIWILNGELEVMDYLEIQDGKATVTKKGEEKLEKYKASLSTEEREALKM